MGTENKEKRKRGAVSFSFRAEIAGVKSCQNLCAFFVIWNANCPWTFDVWGLSSKRCKRTMLGE
jgi:hypothetical protein